MRRVSKRSQLSGTISCHNPGTIPIQEKFGTQTTGKGRYFKSDDGVGEGTGKTLASLQNGKRP